MTQLLKRDAEFKIGQEQLAAVAKLKAALVEEPVLKIFKQTAKTQLHVDASKYGFGEVLLQLNDGKWHQVYYITGARRLQHTKKSCIAPSWK